MKNAEIEDNQNITETVRTEFDALLKSKDSTIQDLQEKISEAKQAKEEAISQKRTSEAKKQELQQAFDRLTVEYDSKMDEQNEQTKLQRQNQNKQKSKRSRTL